MSMTTVSRSDADAGRRTASFRSGFVAYGAAVLVTYVIAAALQTAFVLRDLRSVGAAIDLWTGLRAVCHDLFGLAFNGFFSYLLFVAAGFAVALPLAAQVRKWTGLPPLFLYPFAGAALMAAMLYLAQLVFYGLTLYAGTRGATGLAAQMLAGAVGGAVFALIKKGK